MNKLLALVAGAEAATGLALLVAPSPLAQLLFGAEPNGLAMAFARLAGAALIGLGVACWPGPPRLGLSIYSALAALVLGAIGFTGDSTGVLLWPAVILHVIVPALLIRRSTTSKATKA